MKRVRKLFWVWNFEKEEQWLNEMARQGLVLSSVGFCRYDFTKTDDEYTVRLEFPEKGINTEKGKEYIAFLEETGAEYIGCVKNWIYIKKKKENGEFQLYSDNESRIKHLERIIKFVDIVSLANLLIGVANILIYISSKEPINLAGIFNIAISLLGWMGNSRLKKKKEKLISNRSFYE